MVGFLYASSRFSCLSNEHKITKPRSAPPSFRYTNHDFILDLQSNTATDVGVPTTIRFVRSRCLDGDQCSANFTKANQSGWGHWASVFLKLRAGGKSAKLICFGCKSHVTMREDHIWETGLPDKPICIQVNNTQAKDLISCKPGNRVGNRAGLSNSGTREKGSDIVTIWGANPDVTRIED